MTSCMVRVLGARYLARRPLFHKYTSPMISRPISSFTLSNRASITSLSLQCRRIIHSCRSSTAPFSTSRPHIYIGSSFTVSNSVSRIPHRYASSSTTPLKSKSAPQPALVPAKSPSSNVPVPQVRAKLNPPDSTYAPELDIPSKEPGQNYFKYLFQCGKLYISFYKKGISNVRSTAKLAKTLRQKSAKAGKEDGEGLGVLSRAEYQIVNRSRADMLRLPPFGLLVLIFGEWMPLIALYITPLIPEPCRIPKQVERKLSKLEALRKNREKQLAINAAKLVATDRKPGATNAGVVRAAGVRVEELDKLDLYTLLQLSTRLDAHSKVWDWLFMAPPKSVLRWGVRRKLEYLRRDDGLIERDGGCQAFNQREVERACTERGINVVGRGERELRAELADWFRK
jgi:hypothetical protein